MSGGTPSADDIVAQLPVATLLIDPHGLVGALNPAAETLLNAGAGSLLGRPCHEALRLPEWCLLRLRDATAFAAFDVPLEGRPVDLHVVALVEHEGWRLLTATPRGTERFEGGRADKGRVGLGAAAMLAHEVKNPLSAIRGAAQLLDRSGSEDDQALTKLIRDEVDRIASLIDQMQPLSDARPTERRAINLHDALEHARAVATAAFGGRLAISDAYDPSLPPVLADRDALVQLVLNLLQNAAEAAGEGGGDATLVTRYRGGVSIEGTAGRRALPIELAVIDNGPGAPAELVPHLFEPFVSSKAQGRGLGLALVDKLARDNGGLVQYRRDEARGRTIFRVLLERAPEERE